MGENKISKMALKLPNSYVDIDRDEMEYVV